MLLRRILKAAQLFGSRRGDARVTGAIIMVIVLMAMILLAYYLKP